MWVWMHALSSRPGHTPVRILLVEPDDDDAFIVRCLVARTSRDAECICASGADEAEKALLAGDYDLVLLDGHTACASGSGLLRRLYEERPHIPLVLLTQCEDPDATLIAQRFGVQAIVSKSELDVAWLEGALEGRGADNSTAEPTLERVSAYGRACAAVGVGVLHLRHGKIIACDAAASDLLGGDGSSVLGKDLHSLLGPVAEVGGFALPAENPETYLQSPTGAIVQVRRLEDSRPDTCIAVLTDASEECARRALLLQAWRDAEAFAYGASHDLQGPLRRIVMFTEAIAEEIEASPEAALDFATRAARCAREMSSLTAALLDYSRSGNHCRQMTRATVDLELATHAALASVRERESLRETICEIEVNVHGSAWADPEKTTKVLEALLHNALLYHQKDEPARVTIETRADEHGIEVWVRDRGIGFGPESHERVFLPFERLVARSAYPGNGLGLCTARRWAKRMDGDVRLVHAQNEGGTTFALRLPLAPDLGD